MPYSGEDLHWFPVDPAMSNMKNDGPGCCKPLKRKAITAFFKPRTGLKLPNRASCGEHRSSCMSKYPSGIAGAGTEAAPSVSIKAGKTEPSSQPKSEVKAELTEGDVAELRAPDAAQVAECDTGVKSGDEGPAEHRLPSTPQKRSRQGAPARPSAISVIAHQLTPTSLCELPVDEMSAAAFRGPSYHRYGDWSCVISIC